MVKYLRMYEHNENNFDLNGICVLKEAENVRETLRLDGTRTLEFEIKDVKKRKSVIEERIVKNEKNRLYRIKSIDDGNVYAIAIYNDAAYRHLQYLPDMIGKTVQDIVNAIFENSCIHVMTDEEVKALGMEWVDVKTDLFECEKLTPIGALQILMDTLSKYKHHAELYVDNYSIAVVKQIGTDTGEKLDTKYNVSCMKIKRDTSELVTRLYPYGKDGLHIGAVNSDNQYIDSENYSRWKREGYVDFDEIEVPDELMTAAKQLFAPDNPDRIDIPHYTITVDYAQRNEDNIHLGDIVSIHDREYGIRSKQRVVEEIIYPYEPHKNQIVVGSVGKTMLSVFDGLIDTTTEYQTSINSRGEVKTRWLEMMQHNESITINDALKNEDIALYKTGSLYESPDGTGAVAIIKGRLAVAASKDESGNWEWTTIMDAGKVMVNEVFTGKLYTDLVEVLSKNGTLSIKENLITMKDANKITRFKAGVEEVKTDGKIVYKYVFKMFDAKGKCNLEMDDTGNLTVTGVFQNGYEGTPRVVISDDGIMSYNSNNHPSGLCCGPGASTGYFNLYVDGTPVFSIVPTSGGAVNFNGRNEAALTKVSPFLTYNAGKVTMQGTWKSDQTHNHGIPDGTRLVTVDDDGKQGYVEWEETKALAE